MEQTSVFIDKKFEKFKFTIEFPLKRKLPVVESIPIPKRFKSSQALDFIYAKGYFITKRFPGDIKQSIKDFCEKNNIIPPSFKAQRSDRTFICYIAKPGKHFKIYVCLSVLEFILTSKTKKNLIRPLFARAEFTSKIYIPMCNFNFSAKQFCKFEFYANNKHKSMRFLTLDRLLKTHKNTANEDLYDLLN